MRDISETLKVSVQAAWITFWLDICSKPKSVHVEFHDSGVLALPSLDASDAAVQQPSYKHRIHLFFADIS